MRKAIETFSDSPFNFEKKMDTAYQAYINRIAANSENVVFLNSSTLHASWVMATIFENAKDYVKIFAGTMTTSVSQDSEYQRQFNNFIKRGGKVQILLENYNEGNPLNLNRILKYYEIVKPNSISVKLHKKQLFYTDEDGTDKKIHFCVSDGKMYRLENDTERFLAKGNFNDTIFSKKLAQVFDEIFNDSSSKQVKFSTAKVMA